MEKWAGLKRKKMIARIRGVLIVIEFAISVLIVIALMYIFKKKSHSIRKKYSQLQLFLMGIKIKSIGKADEEASLYLVNHQSLVDIVVLEASGGKNKCWVGKQEIEDIPLFGHLMRAPKMISIDRKDRRSIIKIIKLSKERIKEGRVITMFPEGTRSDGKTLLEFQVGAKILAEKLNLKVQPIVLVNTKYLLDSKKILSRSGEVSVIYLDSIDPTKDENWYEKLKEDMQKRLTDELANISRHR